MIATHAWCFNGRLWAGLNDGHSPPSAELAQMLARLNGAERFSFLLWRMPPGKSLDRVVADTAATEYIQCAGAEDRMTVEVRRTVGGAHEHYVVGRTGPGIPDKELTEVIRWDEHETVVAPHEVFDAAEAAGIFTAYYETGWVPPEYALRSLAI